MSKELVSYDQGKTTDIDLPSDAEETGGICPNCNQAFKFEKYGRKKTSKKRAKRFCSTKCRLEFHGKGKRQRDDKITLCKNCNKEIKTRLPWQEFCSNRCRMTFHDNKRKLRARASGK